MTGHLATLRESYLLLPFTRACLNFITLTFRDGFLWLSGCLARSSKVSPEVHQNFTGISQEFTRMSPEVHRNLTRIHLKCHQKFMCNWMENHVVSRSRLLSKSLGDVLFFCVGVCWAMILAQAALII